MRQIQHCVVRGERGQALVEFAFGSIIFLMTVFGTLQFGLMIWRYNMISNLAQEGARWASVRGSSSTLAHATSSGLTTFLQSRATGIPLTPTPTISPDPAGAPGSIVTVQVRTTFAMMGGLLPTSSFNLSSTAQMIVAR
jgi:Flp pilus assembly protein TadG